MDKKETTRLLNNLLEYNRVDINNLKSIFPDVGDAFMNVILAIDEEYGSGNIDRNLLKTPPLQTVVYDNAQVLTTIEIGTQTWTTKNLNVETYRNGDKIPQVQDANDWEKLTTGAWCYYQNDLTNGTTYGKLYNWFAVNDPRGLAPTGYHIPTDDEWKILTDYLGGDNFAGEKMKSSTKWKNNGNGTNQSGFAGLPGGYRTYDGNFDNIGANGYWWSSSENHSKTAWCRYLYSSDGNVTSSNNDKRNGFSVRCLKDNVQALKPISYDFKVGDKVKIPKSKLGVAGDELKFNSVQTALANGQDFLYITRLGDPNDKNQRIQLWWEKGTSGDIYSIKDLAPYDEPVTNNQTQNLPFKVGDEFQQYGRGTVFVISAIIANRVDISWTDSNGKKDLTSYDIKDAITYFNDKSWILVDKNIPNKSYSFKVGDSFRYSSDTYEIEKIYNENTFDMVSYRQTTGVPIGQKLFPKSEIFASSLEDYIKRGVYTLIPATTSPTSSSATTINYITNWRPEWKAIGLRPSPTRKASLEKSDALGLGNDGIIYEIATDKNGTKKWKKTRYNLFNETIRREFSQIYDRNMLIDQLNYENSQLDKTDDDYKENEKLIKKVLTEVQ